MSTSLVAEHKNVRFMHKRLMILIMGASIGLNSPRYVLVSNCGKAASGDPENRPLQMINTCSVFGVWTYIHAASSPFLSSLNLAGSLLPGEALAFWCA